MFDDLQRVLNKHKTKTPSQESLSGLTKVQTAEKLLSPTYRRKLIEQFSQQLSFKTHDYQQLCQPIIDRVAEFAQSLPETQNSYFSHNGGILDHALERTTSALKLCRAYLLSDNTDQAYSPEQALWAYAVFSASLLHDVGKIAVDLNITLCDEEGHTIQIWDPYQGSMVQQNASHYQYDFETYNRVDLRKRITRILSYQLMPRAGFLWIASQRDVLAVWLAILDDDDRGGGTLGPVLPMADAEVIEYYFERHPDKRFDPWSISDNEQAVNLQTDELDISQLGKDFLEWLRTGIDQSVLSVNESDSLIHVTQDNEIILLYPEVFEAFTEQSHSDENWQKVFEEFTKLDLLKTDVHRDAIQHWQAHKTDQPTVKAVEMKNKYALFKNKLSPARAAQAYVRIPAAMVLPAHVAKALEGRSQTPAPTNDAPAPSMK